MVNIGFVVLHYKTFEDTKKCVSSILCKVPGMPIVVVDNGSFDGSDKKLVECFATEKNVTILVSEKNCGFARGNNLGIDYITKNYNPLFIAVMNNDTIILSDNFLNVINEEYQKSQFAILGPQIITLDGANNSNPVEQITDTTFKVQKLLIKKRVKLLLNKLHLNNFLHDVGTGSVCQGKYDNLKRYENVKLHGACWILSDEYFKVFDGIYDETFLYFEEDIMYIRTVKNNMATVYNPKIVIKHFEDSSTNSISKNSRDKNIFVLKHEISSLKILMKYIREL